MITRARLLIGLTLVALTGLALDAVRLSDQSDQTLAAGTRAIDPGQQFYHPDHPALFDSLEHYLDWYRGRLQTSGAHAYDPDRLTVGLSFHVSYYQQQNIAHVNALVRAIERRGQNAVVLFSKGNAALTEQFVRSGRPIIDSLLFAGERLDLDDDQKGLEQARRLGVPILNVMNAFNLTAADFASSPNSLYPDLMSWVVSGEASGLINPVVVSGKGAPREGGSFAEPFPAQVEWCVDRALNWAKLHRAPNREKRVVMTYWSEGGGKANVGGDPDDFLDVPASLVRLLTEMKSAGYDVGGSPLPDRDALTRRMSREASNVGNWAPAELAERVKTAEVALIPERTYLAWFNALPERNRDAIVEMWGPPPGDVMVYTNPQGLRFLVIPKIELGNVLIAPHPDWGYLQSHKALMSAGALPPHHQYLAFFLWLQRDWRADAWVSLFTNIVLQPGKAEGPAADDDIAIMLGPIAHIHPARLGASAESGTKRKAMGQTIGWFNIVVPSEAGAQLSALRASITRYGASSDPKLRAEAEALIRAEIRRSAIDRAINLDAEHASFTDLLAAVQAYLGRLEQAQMPFGSKVLGDAPTGKPLDDMAAAMVRTSPGNAANTPEQQQALRAEYRARLQTAPREIDGIMEALNGRWIEPGPMDEPLRNPDSLPPGRTIYAFDPAILPTPEAEALGTRLADEMIATHRRSHAGDYPTTLAFVLWAGELAKNNGVTEAEILHLLGTRPIRDGRGQITGVSLVPRDELGRPRVDVVLTASGLYRDHHAAKIDLLTEAARLAAASPEPDNAVAAGTRKSEQQLTAAGETAAVAAAVAGARVFAPAPGAYSPGIQFLAKSGDQRGDAAQMADLYTSRMSHVYGNHLDGRQARTAFEDNLTRIDGAALPRTGNVNGLLDNPSPAGFLGGLNLAARSLTGRDIDLYVNNIGDDRTGSVESAQQQLQTELRTRYFNPKWIAEMKAHGYDGARNMMYLADQLDLWDSTASAMVTSEDWAEVKSVYVEDRLGQGLDAFFDRYNPHAQQVLLADLLGAAQRGQWNASASDLAEVAGRLAQSTIDHGPVCEAGTCRNPGLTAFVDQSLANAPGGPEIAAKYSAAIAAAMAGSPALSRAPSAAAAPLTSPSVPTQSALVPAPIAPMPAAQDPPAVSGRVIEEQATGSKPMQAGPLNQHLWWTIGAVAAVLFGVGWFKGKA